MQQELESIHKRGATDRRRGLGYFDNPFFFASSADLVQWHDTASAWAAGWLAEDKGRDQAMQGLQRVVLW